MPSETKRISPPKHMKVKNKAYHARFVKTAWGYPGQLNRSGGKHANTEMLHCIQRIHNRDKNKRNRNSMSALCSTCTSYQWVAGQ